MKKTTETSADKLQKNCRENLKNLTCLHVRGAYVLQHGIVFPPGGKEEYYEIDITKARVTVEVEVDNSYLGIEDRCTERRTVSTVQANLNGDLYVITAEGDEIPWKNLSTDELGAVARAVELLDK